MPSRHRGRRALGVGVAACGSETNGASGCVQRWDGDDGEEGGDTMQECFDRAGGWQVEENPVLVLFDRMRSQGALIV
jgi:hypothetical protein